MGATSGRRSGGAVLASHPSHRIALRRHAAVLLLAAVGARPAAALAPPLSAGCLGDAAARGLLVTVPARPSQRPVALLGTVHLGNASACDCAELIRRARPTAAVLELSPSRLAAIRSRLQGGGASASGGAAPPPAGVAPAAAPARGPLLLSLARVGLAAGGVGGVAVACLMAREALERERTREEEERELPRVDAFAAAVAAADAVGCRVVAADLELPELITRICRSLHPLDWLGLAAAELRGAPARDPIKRGYVNADETLPEWAARRRDVSVARWERETLY